MGGGELEVEILLRQNLYTCKEDCFFKNVFAFLVWEVYKIVSAWYINKFSNNKIQSSYNCTSVIHIIKCLKYILTQKLAHSK